MRRAPLLLVVFLVSCSPEGLQSRKHYEEALANSSTSPSFIRIAVEQGGKTHITCVYARALVEAIIAENALEGDGALRQAIDLAEGNHSQRFTFKKAAAIRELGLPYDIPQRDEACRIIASGKAAFRSDYSGDIAARD